MDDYFDDDYMDDEFDENCYLGDSLDSTDMEKNSIREHKDENESSEEPFTLEDAFYLGTMMGFAYEEGLEEKGRTKKKKREAEDPKDKDEF